MSIIVKRKGHMENFNEKKLYGSIYAACASAHLTETECEKIANEITKKVKKWLKNKKEINSQELRKKIETELGKKDKELAFFYEEHIPNLKKL